MEQVVTDDPIGRLRAENRAEIIAFRKKQRDASFKQQRLTLQEVEEHVSGITIDEFKELALSLKQKKQSLDVLKTLKNNYCSLIHAEAFFRTEGAFDALMSIFIGKDANKQLEAAACLTNLACCSHKAAQRIIKRAGPYFVCFIGNGSCYLQDQSAWAAGNLADDCFDCFSLLKAQGLLPALLLLLKSPSTEVIKSAIHALHACIKYGDPDLGSIIFAETENLRNLLNLMQENSIAKSTLHSIAFILANIYYLGTLQRYKVSSDEVQIILNCLHKSISNFPIDSLIALPLNRCLGFMTTEYEMCYYLSTQPVFHSCAVQILDSEINCLKVELLWVLTNIAVSGKIVPAVINVNNIFKILDTSSFFLDCSSVQVLYYLSTLATNSKEIKEMLQQENVVQRVLPFLSCDKMIIQKAAKIFFKVIGKHEEFS